MVEKLKTITLTPTWSDVVPIIVAGLQDGNAEGQRMARQELDRMAAIADQQVEALRQAAFSVWVDGEEVNDHYLTQDEAAKLAENHIEEGRDDVRIEFYP